MAGKKKKNSRNRHRGKKRKGRGGPAAAAVAGVQPKRTQETLAQDKKEVELKTSVEDLQLDTPDEIIPEHIIESFDDMTLNDVEQANIRDGEEDMQTAPTHKEVFRPGIDEIKEGEKLEYDSSAYTTMHKLKTRWPCLSFDILRDNLGEFRKKFPQTLYFACGSQATNNRNEVSILKVSELHRTKHDDRDEEDEQNSDSEPEDLDDDPIVEEKSFDHPGCVNRLRNMPQCPGIISTWSDQGKVYVWDTRHYVKALHTPPDYRLPRVKPLHTFTGHPDEGYAMDWSPLKEGNLLTGDCSKHIYLWERHDNGSGWSINKIPFRGHTKSVEDLQWSPTEESVFASCSVDRTIQIWDIRDRKKSQISKKAHKRDVNVISWNRVNSNFLVSGSDDCSIKIWDLRSFQGGAPVGRFNWHHDPITSVSWHPTEETVFGASSDDNSISIWDLSVESDPEHAATGAKLQKGHQIPPQLMFIHQGQTEIKEIQFHPQIPSLMLSTGNEGFNLFKPDNV